MRSRWKSMMGAILALLLVAAPTAALAEPPVTLGSDRVSDSSGVLTAQEKSAAESTLTDLSTDSNIDLWVVYVPTFDSPSDAVQWGIDTADLNGLGSGQYLLSIATDARQLSLIGPVDDPLANRLPDIEASVGEAIGSNDNWAAAVDAAASGLGGGAGGSGGALTVVLLIGFVVVLVIVIVAVARSRKKAQVTAGGGTAALPSEPQQDPAELAKDAAAALVATDDAVKGAEQELSFAVAQFGEEATKPYSEALGTAKAALAKAFDLQQSTDDSQSVETSTQIIQLCQQAHDTLAEKAQDLKELRQMEQNAPEALSRVQQDRQKADGEIAEAAKVLEHLTGSYAPEALAAVADNTSQAAERLTFADARITEAESEIAAGDGTGAAVAIRNAESAVDQAQALAKAIMDLDAALKTSSTDIAALVADLQGDLASAQKLPDPEARLAGAIARTTELLQQASSPEASKNPTQTLALLQKANTEIDEAIAGARGQVQSQQRAQSMLASTLADAQAQVRSAESYITTRRGGVGAEARTSLATAGAELTRAQGLAEQSPDEALKHAQLAIQYAANALSLAQSDVDGMMGGWGGGQRHDDGGDDFLGSLLGGFLGSSMGSSRRDSGWGGGLFGGGGGGGFFGGGGGGRSSGGGISFGGGSSGGGGGGRSSGGGRRF